jgi:citrate lyase subunit beta / citryl-CoA lyase
MLRRSLLYVPGNSMRMITKSFDTDADSLIFDLEDSVSLSEKLNARAGVVECLEKTTQRTKEIIVRINALDTALGLQDLLAIVPKKPDAIIIPKANEAALVTADTIIGAIERDMQFARDSIGLIPLMETADSIVNVTQIVGAARRITAAQFGAEDLTKELGIDRSAHGDELQYARSALIFAGCARGIDILDTPFPNYSDVAALAVETERVRALGMTGKTCIHPCQIASVNSAFTPAVEQVTQARRIVSAFENALAEGKGAFSLDGKMVDAPIAERAQKVIDKADRIAALQGSMKISVSA